MSLKYQITNFSYLGNPMAMVAMIVHVLLKLRTLATRIKLATPTIVLGIFIHTCVLTAGRWTDVNLVVKYDVWMDGRPSLFLTIAT